MLKKNSIFVMRMLKLYLEMCDEWESMKKFPRWHSRKSEAMQEILDLLIDAIWSAKMHFYILHYPLRGWFNIRACQHVAAPVCTQFHIYFFRCFTHHSINEERNVFLIMYFLFFSPFEFLTNICILFYFSFQMQLWNIWKECGNGRENYFFRSYIE